MSAQVTVQENVVTVRLASSLPVMADQLAALNAAYAPDANNPFATLRVGAVVEAMSDPSPGRALEMNGQWLLRSSCPRLSALTPVFQPWSPIQEIAMPSGTAWAYIYWTGSLYFAFQSGIGSSYAVSSDGVNWTVYPLPGGMSNFSDFATNGSTICILSSANSNSVYTSSNGINWAAKPLPTTATWSAIAWSGSMFVAVATSGNTAKSVDGDNWVAGSSIPSNLYNRRLVWNGAAFYVVAPNTNTVYTSVDGNAWSSYSLPIKANWSAIAWNGEVLCIVSSDPIARVVTSPDGVNWSEQQTLSFCSAVSLLSVEGVLVALGGAPNNNGLGMVSYDNGQHWRSFQVLTGRSAHGMLAYNGSELVIASSGVQFIYKQPIYDDRIFVPIGNGAHPLIKKWLIVDEGFEIV